MKPLRKYGRSPYTVVVLHGGPGACGDAAPVAKALSTDYGVLEPMQQSDSISGQIRELELVLKKNTNVPITLIGYSWGAWLAFIFAAKRPEMVEKLVLVSSGPFVEKYAVGIERIRLSRLSENKRMQLDYISTSLSDQKSGNTGEILRKFGELTSEADTFDPLPKRTVHVTLDYEQHVKIWGEAHQLRKSGTLLELGKKIKCPVTAIHGDYDSHPAEGVRIPLSSVLKNFKFVLLEKCGHAPWFERFARDQFFGVLKDVVKAKQRTHTDSTRPSHRVLETFIRKNNRVSGAESRESRFF